MRNARVWQRLLGVGKASVERVEFLDLDLDLDTDRDAGTGAAGAAAGVGVQVRVVAHVRINKGARDRCGRCGKRRPRYDTGQGRRRWRALDLGTVQVVIEADAPRVSCPAHGVVVAAVPWARHGAGHTYEFDQTVAWLATYCPKSAVGTLMRIAWRSVGAIVERVWADTGGATDRLAGLTRIGIDEISYKKGHKYLIVVVDHDTGRLLWAQPGRNEATLTQFFTELGPERCAALELVSADGADWITRAVAGCCPNAIRCADPFHVVSWATDALDDVRRQAWNDAPGRIRAQPSRNGGTGTSAKLKQARYALWKNPDNLTPHQQAQLAWIAKTDPRLYRAYLLKEALRYVFTTKGQTGKEALDRWISWARRCRIPAFVKLSKRILTHRDSIDAALDHGLTNALIESTNTKIRLITRTAYGFRSAGALIALALLALGGHRPQLPQRT